MRYFVESNVSLSIVQSGCGDIHGQFHDLMKLFRTRDHGDFVDRGYNSLEVFTVLLLLKARFMDFMMNARGNMGMLMLGNIARMFLTILLLSAIIDGTVLCVHGGLSPDIRTIDQIRVIERNCEIPHEGPFCDLMWSDPEDIETWGVSPRGAGWLFGSRVTTEFNHINKLELVCRAHQLVQEGLKYMFQDKGLVTEREVKFFTETEENNQMRGPRTGVPYFL